MPERRYRLGWTYLMVSATIAIISATCTGGFRTPLSVWFMPAANSPDFGDLFSRPEQWVQTRRHLDGFVFAAGQIQSAGTHPSQLQKLEALDAFRRIRNWGINTVIGVPALKEWDCSATNTVSITVNLLKLVYAAGGSVQFLEMDEPLVSALGINSPRCKLDLDTAATRVAAYARSVASDPTVVASRLIPRFVDVEAYPSVSVSCLKQWVTALSRQGFVPAAVHIDADVNAIERIPNAMADLRDDLRNLQTFLRDRHIPFGIIIWSGHDPQVSDEQYFNNAMNWIRIIHAAIGHPDRVAFESWVKRGPQTGSVTALNFGCTDSDPTYCGTNSIPINLPESGPGVFSHTRLILESTALLSQ
jgi:hypothetical protein